MQLDHDKNKDLKNNNSKFQIKASVKLESKQVRFWRALMSCHDLLYKHFESNLAEKGLSYSRFQLLFNIQFAPKTSAIVLAEKMNVTRGNMSTFLKRMIQDDLIVEVFEKNKKRCTYELSKKGSNLLEKTLEIHLKEVISTIPQIKEETITELLRISQVMVNA